MVTGVRFLGHRQFYTVTVTEFYTVTVTVISTVPVTATFGDDFYGNSN